MTQPFQLMSQSGIARDGTELDSPFYNDGEWVRFDRGRPRKIGGYRSMSTTADGPVRSLLVDSRGGVNSLHTFSQWGVRRLEFNSNGSGGSLEDRTPASYTPDTRNTWSHGVMASSTGGSYSALLAACTPDLDQLDSDEAGFLYSGNMKTSDPLVQVSDGSGPIRVSGGVTVLGPIAVVYGSNGNIRNSNLNDFSAATGWTVGGSSFANNANPVGTKILYGAPVRGGGQSPAGLFWGLDCLIRMSLSGNTQTLFNYDVLSQPTSILSKKCVVEVDGKFFWIGTDRFLMYSGIVQEIPNQLNMDWFFSNINTDARNKVWGARVARWGEIWWFFPMGSSTECNAAVIYNYRENTWYDALKVRSAGGNVQVFPYPIWAGAEDSRQSTVVTVGVARTLTTQALAGANSIIVSSGTSIQNGNAVRGAGIAPGTTVSSVAGTTVNLSAPTTAQMEVGTGITFSRMTTPFAVGETVTGGTSGATGVVIRAQDTQLNLDTVVGTFSSVGEALTGSAGGAGASVAVAPFVQQLDTIYQQEFGLDKLLGNSPSAIRSSITSKNFGFAVGSPFGDAAQTVNALTKVGRVEPDYRQTGALTLEVLGRDFAGQDAAQIGSLAAAEGQAFVDFRNCQARILQLRVVSNELGGSFWQGKVNITLTPGDQRSGVKT